jgi:hypothetical protein
VTARCDWRNGRMEIHPPRPDCAHKKHKALSVSGSD